MYYKTVLYHELLSLICCNDTYRFLNDIHVWHFYSASKLRLDNVGVFDRQSNRNGDI